MITNKEISEFLITKLSNSIELRDYCNDNFGKEPLIFLGIDTENPPKERDYPLISLAPLANEMSDSNTNYDYEIVLHIFIKDGDPNITGNIIRYEGIYKVEEFGNIVVKELKEAFCNTNLEAYDITFYNHEITLFPIYTGAVVINFSVPNVIGDEQLNLI